MAGGEQDLGEVAFQPVAEGPEGDHGPAGGGGYLEEVVRALFFFYPRLFFCNIL